MSGLWGPGKGLARHLSESFLNGLGSKPEKEVADLGRDSSRHNVVYRVMASIQQSMGFAFDKHDFKASRHGLSRVLF